MTICHFQVKMLKMLEVTLQTHTYKTLHFGRNYLFFLVVDLQTSLMFHVINIIDV